MSQEPTFLDRFLVHLALHLLADVPAIEELLTGTKRNQLYWRSPLAQATNGLGFIDWTLELSTTLSLRFGFFFRSTHSQYLQCHPLTQDQLEQHAQTVGLDMDSGPPEAMAKMMAHALISDTVQAQVDGTTVSFSWWYPDIQERGEFIHCPVQHQSEFDAVGTTLLYSNLQRTQSKESTISASEEVLVERYLRHWYDQKSHGIVESEPVVSTVENRKRATVRGQYVSVATKPRKKKGKIMYAKSDKSNIDEND